MKDVIKIAIVDDETVIGELLEHYTRKWCEEQQVEVSIDLFTSAEAFSFEWETSRAYDVVLLDIQMKGASGIVLAKQIRKLDKWLRIIFITGIADYVYEGYEVSALNYLLKPVSKEKLFECLNRAYDAISNDANPIQTPMFVFEIEGQTHRVKQSEILYAEAQKNYTLLVLKDQNYLIRQSFSDIFEQLDAKCFVKTHRSYFVGLEHIRFVDHQEVVLDNGMKVMLSRNNRNDVQKTFIQFYKEAARNQ